MKVRATANAAVTTTPQNYLDGINLCYQTKNPKTISKLSGSSTYTALGSASFSHSAVSRSNSAVTAENSRFNCIAAPPAS